MLNRLRITGAVLGVVALFVAIALALTWKRPAMTVSPVVALSPATTRSSNAADSYGEAVRIFDSLRHSGPDSTRLDRYNDGASFDGGAAALFERYGGIVHQVCAGAGAPDCDWGEPDMQARIKSINGLRGVARFTIVHAR